MTFQANYNRYKIIIKNTGYLSILEVLKMLMPFIALPYIITTIGTSNYGLVVFAQAIMAYFTVLINWGIDISAVKHVSINRDDKTKLSEIVSSVLLIKIFLFSVSFLLLCVLLLCVDTFRQNALLFFFSFLACISEVLFPVWFYQGIEKMKYITLVRFSSILFYTISIFVVIKTPNDYIILPLLQSIGWLLSGTISFYLLLKKEKLSLLLPEKNIIKQYFKESTPFFISRLSVVFNANLAKTICAFMFPMSTVGAFDLAQKIAYIAFVPLQMLNQAIYPNIAKSKDKRFATKGFFVMIILLFIILLGVYVLAPYAINLLSKGELLDAVPLLRAFTFFIFCGGIALYTGSPLLVAFGYSKPFNLSVLLSSIFLMLIYMGLYFFDLFTIINFVYALGAAECLIACYRLYYCFHYKIINLNV